MPSSRKRIRKHHPLRWLVEPLMEEASYLEKPMFGCEACYLYGRLALVLADGDEPWNGLLIPTERDFHGSVIKDFKGVVQHPVLKKWLYVSQSSEDFETIASEIVEAVRMNDPRLGVEPKERALKRSRKT
jgi:hypothetical protein